MYARGPPGSSWIWLSFVIEVGYEQRLHEGECANKSKTLIQNSSSRFTTPSIIKLLN